MPNYLSFKKSQSRAVVWEEQRYSTREIVLLDFAHDGPLYGLIVSVWYLRGEIFLRKFFEMNTILKFFSNISKFNANVSPFNVVEEYLMMNERCFSFFFWWWIIFVVWLTDERSLTLFPAGTIVRDFPHRRVWTCTEP